MFREGANLECDQFLEGKRHFFSYFFLFSHPVHICVSDCISKSINSIRSSDECKKKDGSSIAISILVTKSYHFEMISKITFGQASFTEVYI